MRSSRPTLAVLALVLFVACGCGGERDRPPSVVLLILDTLRADRLSSYGCEAATSPELDALAARGVLFEHAIAQSPWTRPSAGSMLTSRHPRTIGIYEEKDGVLDDRFTTLAECFRAVGYSTLGLTANPHLNRSFNFHQGFDRYFDSDFVFAFMDEAGAKPVLGTGKLASARQLFGKALEVIRESPGAAPWYVQINVMDVHEWFRGRFTLTRPEYRRLFPREREVLYLQAVRQVSADVGAFVRELSVIPGFDDAVFVITSDHGEGLWDHPGVEKSQYHGRLLYESQVWVPWIMCSTRWPGPARRIERPVRLLDLMPTVLECAGVTVPPSCEGVSLLPWLSGGADVVALPGYFVAETKLRGHDKAAVYSAEWKYIEARDGHPGTSPRELQRVGTAEDGAATNLLAEHRDVADAMARHLAAWAAATPEAEPTISPTGISAEEERQLRSIGYLGGDQPEKR